MGEKRKRFLIAILRFHGDVLLTTPLIDEIKRIHPKSILDLLVYKGTGVLLEADKRINHILEKISKSGYDALSKEEKAFLFKQGSK